MTTELDLQDIAWSFGTERAKKEYIELCRKADALDALARCEEVYYTNPSDDLPYYQNWIRDEDGSLLERVERDLLKREVGWWNHYLDVGKRW